MEPPLQVTPEITIPGSALHWQFSRSGGNGGQSVNTTDSRVELSFNLLLSDVFPEPLHARALSRLSGEIIVTSERFKSQLQNRNDARKKLVGILQDGIAAPPPTRRPTRPSKSKVRARLDDKSRQGEKKEMRKRPTLGD